MESTKSLLVDRYSVRSSVVLDFLRIYSHYSGRSLAHLLALLVRQWANPFGAACAFDRQSTAWNSNKVCWIWKCSLNLEKVHQCWKNSSKLKKVHQIWKKSSNWKKFIEFEKKSSNLKKVHQIWKKVHQIWKEFIDV